MTRPNAQPRGGQQVLGDERSLTDVMQAVQDKSERVRLAMFDLQMETETLTRKLVEAQVNLFGRSPGGPVNEGRWPEPVRRGYETPPGGRQPEAPFRGEDEPRVAALAEKFAAPPKPGSRPGQ